MLLLQVWGRKQFSKVTILTRKKSVKPNKNGSAYYFVVLLYLPLRFSLSKMSSYEYKLAILLLNSGIAAEVDIGVFVILVEFLVLVVLLLLAIGVVIIVASV